MYASLLFFYISYACTVQASPQISLFSPPVDLGDSFSAPIVSLTEGFRRIHTGGRAERSQRSGPTEWLLRQFRLFPFIRSPNTDVGLGWALRYRVT